MKTKTAFLFTGLLMALFFIVYTVTYKANTDTTYKLSFFAKNGENALTFGNPEPVAGFPEYLVNIRNFRFYISNIRFGTDSEHFAVPDSYHLVKFNETTNLYSLEINNVPRKDYSTITFTVGVDPVANSSYESVGDLDPNSQMAWSWDVGYKFVVVEGNIADSTSTKPLVYHIGLSENAQQLRFSLDSSLLTDNTLEFAVDVSRLWTGEFTVDPFVNNAVKFEKETASKISRNFSSMVFLTDE